MRPPLTILRSPNVDERRAPIEFVMLHYTGMASAAAALQRLCDGAPVAGRYPGPWQPEDADPAMPLARVSAHYVVDEQGRVYALAPEQDRAWHAGSGRWKGRDDLNSRSIGIEIVNGGHDFDLPPYRPAQIAAVIALLEDILARHGLGRAAVIGHSDAAPGRKADPGEHFPWKQLAAANVAIGPLPASDFAPCADLAAALTAFGYDTAPPLEERIRAFQRRFRPTRVDGAADAETCAQAAALLAAGGL